MQKNQDDLFQETLLLWEKENKKKKKHSVFPLICLGVLGFAISFCSYRLFEKENRTGEIAAASTFFSDFAEENEAIAVFLGLNEEE